MSEDRASRIIPHLGFGAHFQVPLVGFAGGIWVLWDPSIVSVHITVYHAQAVHAIVSFNREREWLFFFTYVSPNPVHRCVLWEDLSAVNSQ